MLQPFHKKEIEPATLQQMRRHRFELAFEKAIRNIKARLDKATVSADPKDLEGGDWFA